MEEQDYDGMFLDHPLDNSMIVIDNPLRSFKAISNPLNINLNYSGYHEIAYNDTKLSLLFCHI